MGDRLEYQRTDENVVEEGKGEVVWQKATIVKMITSNPSMYVGEQSGGSAVGGKGRLDVVVLHIWLCVSSCACRKL